MRQTTSISHTITLQATIIAALLALPTLTFADGPTTHRGTVRKNTTTTLAQQAKAALKKDQQRRKIAAKRRIELQSVTAGTIQRLPDQRLKGRINKPNVVIFLPRSFTAPTSLMSTQVWMPKRHDTRTSAVALAAR